MNPAATMMDFPLTIGHLLRHGRRVHGDSVVSTWAPERVRRASFAEVAVRVERLAAALHRLGVAAGDRVGTLGWNHQEHLEAYLAIPTMGAVLHTLNLRLFPEQLAYVINHAGDKAIICDASLVGQLAQIAKELRTVRHVIVVGTAADVDAARAQLTGLRVAGAYEELLAAEEPGFAWPELDERAPAAVGYTSGTTGNPKGVVYTHRSQFLHSMSLNAAATFGITEHDRILVIVPMFHAHAWGTPYAGWWAGADLLMPQRYLQAEHLARLIMSERPTFSAGVPTIWNDLVRYEMPGGVDLSSLRAVVAGGSAVPRSLIERFEQRFGVPIIQAWGMTEASPLCAVSRAPKGAAPEQVMDFRSRTGRVLPGVELRIVGDDGQEAPWDGEAVGEIQIRGPWVTGSYAGDPSPEKFDRGWLRTGDVGTVDPHGFIQITDRAKDVIKSGGEWISSVELENALMGHSDVVEASVVAVPDERWGERPLACVVLRKGATVEPAALRAFLAEKFPAWWLPENWTFIDEVPKTSVGKFDKKLLRARHAAGELKLHQGKD